MYWNFVALAKVILRLFFRIECVNWERIPTEGGCILCANHLSNWDPILLSCYYPRQVSWMGKKELFQVPVLGRILKELGVISVDRQNQDMGALRWGLRCLKEGHDLGIFPEGTRSKGRQIDAKAGVGLLAVKGKAIVVPVRIEGNFRLFSKIRLVAEEPINMRNCDSKDYQEIATAIMDRIRGEETWRLS